MTFFLFVLVNATLFIRPAEIVPSLIGLPIYNVLISACLVAAFNKVAAQLTGPALRENPLTACVLGIFLAILASHLSHLNLAAAKDAASDFGKVVLYYLLMVAVLDTPARYHRFLWVLAALIVVLTVIALLQYHGYIDLETLRGVEDMEINPQTGEEYSVLRMCSTGIYNDPNDLCLILLVGMGLCVYGVGNRGLGPLRLLWIVPLVAFGYALTKTHSRGGFLAMLAAMMVLFHARFGTRKAAALAVVALPPMLVLFGGRQTSISLSDDTGQDRIQIWAEGLGLFKRSPIFGIGYGRYAEEVGLVAHNSYVHGFTELGLFGGVLFVGTFYYSMSTLYRVARDEAAITDPALARFRPYLTAIVAAYAAGILTVSRNYIVPTYMVLGLVAIYVRLVAPGAGIAVPNFDAPLLKRFAVAGVASLIAFEVFVRIFARFG